MFKNTIQKIFNVKYYKYHICKYLSHLFILFYYGLLILLVNYSIYILSITRKFLTNIVLFWINIDIVIYFNLGYVYYFFFSLYNLFV